jgi:hypothetical protein
MRKIYKTPDGAFYAWLGQYYYTIRKHGIGYTTKGPRNQGRKRGILRGKGQILGTGSKFDMPGVFFRKKK